MFEKIEETIKELFNSGESLYSISKGSGISYSTIHDLSELDNYDMTRFKTVRALYEYAEKMQKEKD